MTDTTTPDVVETIEAPVETPVDTAGETTEVVETAPEKFKPWEIKDKDEDETPADNKRKPAIPYDRVREVNEEM